MSHWQQLLEESRNTLSSKRPLVHHITNYVVMNLTANVTLALGASPVMAHDVGEAEEMASFASAVVLNIGTLSPRWLDAMHLAGKKAKARKIPVVLDPVGAGATALRTDACRKLLSDVRPDIIRGNRAEITVLAGASARISGVDSLETGADPLDLYRAFARSSGAVICVSGPTDWVTNGDRVLRVDNGHPLFSRVTGMGCSATTAVGVFAATGLPLPDATALAMGVFGACGEEAAAASHGPGTFVPALLDALYRASGAALGPSLRIAEA
jgi:hydroxyethylthiazole kinase